MIKEISNEDLKLADIPSLESIKEKWSKFAGTFNGYKQIGGSNNDEQFDRLQDFGSRIQEQYPKIALDKLTLKELRLCLFYMQRAIHHSGYVEEGDMSFITSLIENIRNKVVSEQKEIGREKISEPNLEMKQQMYEFYKMTFNSCFTERKKINLMTSISGWEKWSWRVVGITQNAINEIHSNNGNSKVTKLLVRDHFFQGRSETYKKMLSKLLSFEEWWSEFWENDRTILMTKVEHNKIEKIKKDEGNLKETKSQIYELDWKSGLFQSGNVAGFLFAKKYEGDFIIKNFKKTN